MDLIKIVRSLLPVLTLPVADPGFSINGGALYYVANGGAHISVFR